MNTSYFRLIPLLLSIFTTVCLRAQAPADKPERDASSTTITVTADVQPAPDSENTLVPATTAKDANEPTDKAHKPAKAKKPRTPHNNGPQAQPFAAIEVKLGDTAHEAVSVLGSTKVAGEVLGDAVAVLGPNTITGKVGGSAVSIFNDLTIDGEVNGDSVCILGTTKFGPNARVHGQVVSVLGAVDRDPAAEIDGQMNIVGGNLPGGVDFGAFGLWFKECLCKGRLLAFKSGLGVFWLFALSITLFQILIAFLFSKKVNHCCELLETRPGYSVLSAMLTLMITPLLVILLLATGIGILLVPFIVIGMFAVGVFGRVMIQAAIGRLFTGRQAAGVLNHAALTTLIGSVIVLLLYTIPVLSLLLHPLLGFLGTGVVVYALFQYYRANNSKASAIPAPPPARPQSFRPSPSASTSTVAAARVTTAPSISAPLATATPLTPLTLESSVLAAAPSISTAVPLAESGSLPPIAFGPRPGADSTQLPPQAPSFTPAPDLIAEAPTGMPALPTQAAALSGTVNTPSLPPLPEQATTASSAATTQSTVPPAATPQEPEAEVPLTALPRATFGIRMLALLIDYVLVAMVAHFGSNFVPGFLHISSINGTILLLATYGVLLWKHRGATVGDIIFRLQVIRTDDRPIDWTTSIVRGLGCLLSGFALGIGFLWIYIDPDREAWHDKIAGTAVVRIPQNRPIV